MGASGPPVGSISHAARFGGGFSFFSSFQSFCPVFPVATASAAASGESIELQSVHAVGRLYFSRYLLLLGSGSMSHGQSEYFIV